MLKPSTASAPFRTPTARRGRLVAATLALAGTAPGEPELEPLVVSALRSPLDASELTSAVTRLDPRDLQRRGILDLRQALNEAPGVIATSTSGQTGAVGSLFIRGTTTADSQLIVDGVRLSDATAPLGNFLSGARVDDLGRIEVLRGPQSAIHGGESVGGVVWLETARGRGEPAGQLRLEGGSFDTLHGFASHAGEQDGFRWFAGLGHDATRNDALGQNFDQSRAALRLEQSLGGDQAVGMTLRLTDSRFDYPNFGPNIDHLDSALVTLYANHRLHEAWRARTTLGHYRESYDNDGPFGNFATDLDRSVLNSDHVVTLDDCHQLLFGGFFERSDFENTIGTAVERDRLGGYLGWRWQPLDGLVTDAVARWEDDESFGDEWTWRLGASWRALDDTRLRAGVGRAYRAPTFLDLFGTAFGAGNPALSPQTSLGWDLGIEQRLGDNHRLSLTWFENSIEDRIQSFPTPPVNLPGETPTRGLETALDGAWCDGLVRYRLAWTWLDASLQDQPEHVATASLDWRVAERLTLGVGASYVDERSFGGAPLDDYLLLRLYGRYRLSETLEFHARVENLSDQTYELANFTGNPIEGAGLGAFAGIRASF